MVPQSFVCNVTVEEAAALFRVCSVSSEIYTVMLRNKVTIVNSVKG